MKILLVIVSIILMICLVLIIYLLVSPFRVILDSKVGYLTVGWSSWLSARVFEDHGHWIVRFRIPFWEKKMRLSQLMKSKKKSKKKKKKRGLWLFSKPGNKKFGLKKIQRLVGQIKIKELSLKLDTDNFIWNAYLTPVFELLKYKTGHRLNVNFMGLNEIKLKAESRIIKVLAVGMF